MDKNASKDRRLNELVARLYPNCSLWTRIECKRFCLNECHFRKKGICKPVSLFA